MVTIPLSSPPSSSFPSLDVLPPEKPPSSSKPSSPLVFLSKLLPSFLFTDQQACRLQPPAWSSMLLAVSMQLVAFQKGVPHSLPPVKKNEKEFHYFVVRKKGSTIIFEDFSVSILDCREG